MRPAVRVVIVLGVERLAGLLAVRPDDGVDGRLRIEAVRVRTDAELAQLLEIGAALDDLIGFFGRGHSRSKRRRIASRMPLMNRTESSLLKVRASSSASLMMTGRRVRLVQELVDRQPQDQPIQHVHPLDAPVLGRFGDHRVEVADGVDHAGGELLREAPMVVRQRHRLRVVMQPERGQHLVERRAPDFPLIEHLHGRFARAMPRFLAELAARSAVRFWSSRPRLVPDAC